MKRSERDEAVKKFNNSPRYKCLLMSLKAGGRFGIVPDFLPFSLTSLAGVGLNLTGGNRVILLDLAWSPAVEGQGTIVCLDSKSSHTWLNLCCLVRSH